MNKMDGEAVLKSTQEQAVASWVNYLNQIRIQRLMDALKIENDNLDQAMETIGNALKTIREDIVQNGKGRGGETGMHGFIAEVAECGIGNARSQIEGNKAIYEWINDNGPEDLRRGASFIQQKFVQSGDHLSLQAIQKHLEKYPDFLKNNGKYQIPADHYNKIKWLLSIPEKEANKMPTSTGDFSLRQWREVHDFFEKNNVPLDSIEPSELEYSSVWRNTYEKTFSNEKERLKQRNQERRDEAYQKSKPSVKQGAGVAAASAIVEGGTAFCMSIARKRKSGKKLSDFDANDWKEVAADSGTGAVTGGARGYSIYLLTNFTATPAAVANAIVTASLGIAEQAHLYRQGNLNKTDFLENSELLCVDAAVSALSSLVGEVIIPVPVLGAVIGNAVGSILYQIAKDNLSDKEQKMVNTYLQDLQSQKAMLEREYQDFLDSLAENLRIYMDLLDHAFSPDIKTAFDGSVSLAKAMGVPDDEILDTREKTLAYFME